MRLDLLRDEDSRKWPPTLQPPGWTVSQVRSVASIRNGFPFDSSQFAIGEGEPVIRNRDLANDRTEVGYLGQSLESARVQTGDVLVSMDGDFRVARWRGPKALLNQRMCSLRAKQGVSEDFLVYQLPLVLERMNALTPSTTVRHLSSSDILHAPLTLPPLQKQRAIVRFLDEETAKVDFLLRRSEALLARLEEQRRGMVATAVTKGIAGARLRASGIEWIGDIPKHWAVRRVKHVARLASGHTPSRAHPEFWLDAHIPWFQLTDIWQFRDDSAETIHETAERVSELGIRNSAAELLPAGTVALSRTASVGFSAILATDMATTQDFANWVPGPDVDSTYLLYVMRAIRPELERLRFGSTHKTVYMPAIGQLAMPLPPLDEQRAIADHVARESRRLFEAKNRIHKLLEVLKEYRSALVTAAVTGQIDVENAA